MMLCRAARISQATRPALQLQITTEPARIETWCYPLTAPLRRISPGWLRAACRRGNLDKHMLAQNSMQQGSVADSDQAGVPVEGELCGLQLSQQTLLVRHQPLTLVIPRSVDSVIDLYIGDQSKPGATTQDPYWCRVWPSALALAELLLAKPHLVYGRRVLELGCGLGVAGIAAALAGAKQVILTDRDDVALQFALRSAMACGLRCERGPFETLREAEAAGSAQVSAAALDWYAPVLAAVPSMDVVLAADVMYDATAAKPLAGLCPALLKPGAQPGLIMADPEDRTRHHRQQFLDCICQQPGNLTLHSAELHNITMDNIKSNIRMLLLHCQN